MDNSTSDPKPLKADLQSDDTPIEGGNLAAVQPGATDFQSLERMEQSEAGNDVTSTAEHQLHSPQEARPYPEASISHMDALTPSPVATPNDSQSASKSSSVQDMGSYFSPRIPEHSVSSDNMAGLQTPPTPITELREWSESKLAHDSLADGYQQTRVESNSPLFEAPGITWKESAQQTVIGPSTIRSPTTRPTSVPNLITETASKKRRDGPEYPVYPDQSFAALQAQQHARPCPPYPLRTRSSHPSQSYSSSSIPSSRSRDFTTQSGAKTTSNTPAQSPGLFTPTFARGRADDPAKTPTLHPSHLQTPTE